PRSRNFWMGGMPWPIIISTGEASDTVPPESTIIWISVSFSVVQWMYVVSGTSSPASPIPWPLAALPDEPTPTGVLVRAPAARARAWGARVRGSRERAKAGKWGAGAASASVTIWSFDEKCSLAARTNHDGWRSSHLPHHGNPYANTARMPESLSAWTTASVCA